jgi:hypothetical protein
MLPLSTLPPTIGAETTTGEATPVVEVPELNEIDPNPCAGTVGVAVGVSVAVGVGYLLPYWSECSLEEPVY